MLALAASGFAACTPQPEYPECKTDAICGQHAQVCASGFCRDCRDDSQCKAGQQCIQGACAVKPECSPDQACANGLVCREGKCAPECSEATAAQDCGAGHACVSSRCVARELCAGDGECGMGKACVAGVCRDQASITGGLQGAALPCTAGPVYFAYDEPTLDPRAREVLGEAFACVQREGYRKLRLTGHADERGTTEYNLALGGRRADAVRKYLIGLGADGRKLQTVSFGKERPADDGHTEAAFARNRRVELELEK